MRTRTMHGVAPDPNWNPRGKRSLELVFPDRSTASDPATLNPTPHDVAVSQWKRLLHDQAMELEADSPSANEAASDAHLPITPWRPVARRGLGLMLIAGVLFGAFTLLDNAEARETTLSWATMGHSAEVASTARRIESTILSLLEK